MRNEENLTRNWIALQFKVQEKKIVEAFRLFRENNIEPILIKGWAIARLYPKDNPRAFADIDLCVAKADYKKADQILTSAEAKRLNIDLHCELRHLDTLAWEDLFDNSQLVKIDETPVRILRPEDHLRILSVHWLTDSGARKDRLLDIYYGFAGTNNFDWKRCLESVSQNRRRWIVCTIGLAEKYFGVSLINTPFENEKILLPEWLYKRCELEWKKSVPLKPLHLCLKDPRELVQQIKKRIPPNPIQATIETEGSFDSRTRILYQFKNFFQRLYPSYERVKSALLNPKK